MLLGLPGVHLPDYTPSPALQRRLYSPGTDRDRRAHRPVSGGQSTQPGTVGQLPVTASPRPPAFCLSPRCGPFPVPCACPLCANRDASVQPATHILHLLFSPHLLLSIPFFCPKTPHTFPSQPKLRFCIPPSLPMFTNLLLHPCLQSPVPSPWTHARAHSTPHSSPSAQVSS